MAMPLVILAFPMLGLAHVHDTFHDTLIAAITLTVLLALVPGYLKHRDKTTLLVGCAGLAVPFPGPAALAAPFPPHRLAVLRPADTDRDGVGPPPLQGPPKPQA